MVNLETYVDKKGCIAQIKSDDEMCCSRAIIVAKAKFDKDPQYKSIVTWRETLQRRLAQDLHDAAGVPLGPCGIEEVKKFQDALPEYQLNVVSKDHLNTLIYSGPPTDKPLYIYHHFRLQQVRRPGKPSVLPATCGDESLFWSKYSGRVLSMALPTIKH